jgi:O-antigen ligase
VKLARGGAWLLCGLGAVLPVSLGLANVLAGAVCAAALAVAIRGGSLQWRRWRWLGAGLLALWLTHAVSTWLSPRPRWDTMVDELWLKSLLLAVPILDGSGGRDGERGLRVFAVVAVVVAAFAVTQHFHGLDPWRGGQVARFGERFQSVGFFGHHLSYGGHLLVVFALLLSQALWGERTRLAASGLCIVLLALLWSHARSAQLGAVAAALVLIWRSRGALRRRAALALLAVAALALLVPTVRARWSQFGELRSDTTRVLLWQSSLDGIRDRPLSGWGPGNFSLLLEQHERPGDYESRAHAHNDVLMYAVNAGLPAVAAALGLFLSLWRLTLASAHGDSNSVAAGAALACLAGFLVAGMFQVYQTDDEVELSLYYLLGHGLRAKGAEAA